MVLAMSNNTKVCLLTSFLTLSTLNSYAFDVDLGPLGHACDTCGGGVLGGLPIVGPTLNEIVSQAGAPGLEQWIIQSRNTAINGASPIPPYIRQLLTGYASEDSMNKVRYKVEDGGFINLARVIEQSGSAKAVTLIDVIVFRDNAGANDPALWAHELHHVDQYTSWGTRDFAISYIRDHGEVERPAYAKGDGYAAWRQTRGFPPPVINMPPPVINMPPPPPPGLGMAPQPVVQMQAPPVGAFCQTQIGVFGPGPVNVVGAPCYVQLPQGLIPGFVIR